MGARYDSVDDGSLVRGLGDQIRAGRQRVQRMMNAPLAPLTPERASAARAHARALRQKIAQLPHRGDQLSEAPWEMEVANLVEDVAASVLDVACALPLLEWVTGLVTRAGRE